MAAQAAAQNPPAGPPAAPSVPVQAPGPAVLPGTPDSAFATILGSALSPTNTGLPNTVMQLRDARLGRVVAVKTTDQIGAFAFRLVDPGTYIIELLGSDQSIQATSQLLNVDAGDSITVIVKMPSRLEAFAGFLGRSVPQAAAIAAAAAAAGVLAVQSTTDVSPR